MIVILGDLHANFSKPYFAATCEAFLSWYQNWKYNNSDNEIIFAGDLVQTAVNGGAVIDYLERLYTSSRFKKIHIVVGNHDVKRIEMQDQLAYEFYRTKPRVVIYDEPAKVSLEGLSCLILPYKRKIGKYTMKEYYENLPNNSKFKGHYQLVVGHFAMPDAGIKGAHDCIDLKVPCDKLCLGHIHTRVAPDHYIGSIYAGRKNENSNNRAAWVWNGSSWIEENLPIFNEFLPAVYPLPLPRSEAIIPIYTICNCGSEAVARAQYGDIYIRRVTTESQDETNKKAEYLDKDLISLKNMNLDEVWDEFLKSQDPPLPVPVSDYCKSFLRALSL